MSGGRVFAGFGFGPIQAGLFVPEARACGAFDRCVIAEIDAALVAAVRANGDRYAVNVAHRDRIERVDVDGVRLENPGVDADRGRLADALSAAREAATCLPSVAIYGAGGERGVAALLARGLAREGGPACVVYAAENHNHAAEILDARLTATGLPRRRPAVLLNTVIGKMSRVVDDPAEIGALGLAPIAPGLPRAFLVEAFNRILVSRPAPAGVTRAIAVFEEKADLLPFEEAKLYGHNAIHALIGFLGAVRGVRRMSDAARDVAILDTARTAFVDECGAALVRKHAGMRDPLFTAAGFRAYAEDLLDRMANPFLADPTARAVRDPERKLGYDDRIFGAMRLVLGQGIEPRRLACGAAAGLRLRPGAAPSDLASAADVAAVLSRLWRRPPDDELRRLAALVASAATAS